GGGANYSEEVVEIMSDASGQPADGFHLLSSPKLLFELFLFRDVAAEIRHAGELSGLVANTEDPGLDQNGLAGNKVAHSELAFPNVARPNQGKNLLVQDGLLSLIQEVVRGLGLGLSRVA